MTCFFFVCLFFDGGGRNIPRGGKWGVRGREAGGEREGSGGNGGGKRGLGTPLSTPTSMTLCDFVVASLQSFPSKICSYSSVPLVVFLFTIV